MSNVRSSPNKVRNFCFVIPSRINWHRVQENRTIGPILMKPPGIAVVMYLNATIPQGNFARLQYIEMQVVTAWCLHWQIAASEERKCNSWKFTEDIFSFSDFANYLQKIYLYSKSQVVGGLKEYWHKISVLRFFSLLWVPTRPLIIEWFIGWLTAM